MFLLLVLVCELHLPEPPPAAPSALRSMALSGRMVRLQWTDNSDDESGFTVYQSVGTGPFVGPFLPILTVPANTTIALVQLLPGRTYSFRVTAFGRYGESPPSNIVRIETNPVKRRAVGR